MTHDVNRSPRDADPITADAVQATERSSLQSLVAVDIDRAAQLHADDFQLVTPSGATFSKSEYLEAVAAGAIGYREWEITTPIEVRLHGNSAAIRYGSRIEIGFDEDRTTLRCWHTDTYEHRNGRWQVVWSQATAIR